MHYEHTWLYMPAHTRYTRVVHWMSAQHAGYVEVVACVSSCAHTSHAHMCMPGTMAYHLSASMRVTPSTSPISGYGAGAATPG